MPTNQPTSLIPACQQHIQHRSWSQGSSNVIATGLQCWPEEELEACFEKYFRLIHTTGNCAVYRYFGGEKKETVWGQCQNWFCFVLTASIFRVPFTTLIKEHKLSLWGEKLSLPSGVVKLTKCSQITSWGWVFNPLIKTRIWDHPFLANTTGTNSSVVATITWQVLK